VCLAACYPKGYRNLAQAYVAATRRGMYVLKPSQARRSLRRRPGLSPARIATRSVAGGAKEPVSHLHELPPPRTFARDSIWRRDQFNSAHFAPFVRKVDGCRFDYLLVESTGISEPLPAAEPRLGRRIVLTFPLLPPPQKN
jgi:hypothetical protein